MVSKRRPRNRARPDRQPPIVARVLSRRRRRERRLRLLVWRTRLSFAQRPGRERAGLHHDGGAGIPRCERFQARAGVDDRFLGDDVTGFVQDAHSVAAISDGARQRGEGHAPGVARSEAKVEEGGSPWHAGGRTNKSSPIVNLSLGFIRRSITHRAHLRFTPLRLLIPTG